MEYADKSERMTDTALANASGNGREIAFSPSGAFTTEQFFPHFLWFKIISSKFQTCLGQEQGLPLHGKAQLLTPVNRPDPTYDTGYIGPQKENEYDDVFREK
jgi:hypothetical protein